MYITKYRGRDILLVLLVCEINLLNLLYWKCYDILSEKIHYNRY